MNWFKQWLRKQALRAGFTMCHDAAEQICHIGQEHEARIQRHLNNAKDELYLAANEFERERKLIEADQRFARQLRYAKRHGQA